MQEKKQGLYVSYDEKEFGDFDQAIRVSNTRGCVTWFESSGLNPENWACPTDIIIRTKGQERYYRGTLLAVARYEDVEKDFRKNEGNHRPMSWREHDSKDSEVTRSILFIHAIRMLDGRPKELGGLEAPQHPVYFDLDDGRATAFRIISA